MNRFYTNLALLILCLTLIVIVLWTRQPSVPWFLAVAAFFVVAAYATRRIHRHHFTRQLRTEGYRLVQFGEINGFISYGDAPWWEWLKSYCGTIASEAGEVIPCHFHIRGPFYAIVSPEVSWESELEYSKSMRHFDAESGFGSSEISGDHGQ